MSERIRKISDAIMVQYTLDDKKMYLTELLNHTYNRLTDLEKQMKPLEDNCHYHDTDSGLTMVPRSVTDSVMERGSPQSPDQPDSEKNEDACEIDLPNTTCTYDKAKQHFCLQHGLLYTQSEVDKLVRGGRRYPLQVIEAAMNYICQLVSLLPSEKQQSALNETKKYGKILAELRKEVSE